MSWRTVYGHFASWCQRQIWDRILRKLARSACGRIYGMDSSYIRVHQAAANVAGGSRAKEAMGPSRGGLTTKIHALVDGTGRAIRLLLSPGNVADVSMAPALVENLAATSCRTLVADKGYDSDRLRVILFEQGIFPCLAINATRKEARGFHRGHYRKRHRVENFFCALKKFRRISTRYDKLQSAFLGFVTLATILLWIP